MPAEQLGSTRWHYGVTDGAQSAYIAAGVEVLRGSDGPNDIMKLRIGRGDRTRTGSNPKPKSSVTAAGLERPSVLLVTDYYPIHGGGLEIVAGQLATRLASMAEIKWFAAGPAGGLGQSGLNLRPMRCWNGLERRLGLPVPIPSPKSLVAVVKAARASDVVWVHDLIYLANLVAALTAIAAHKPLVVTVHVGAIPYRNVAVRKIMAATLTVTGQLILRRAAAVSFVSERVQGEFLARWRLRKAWLIPNGVDFGTFKPLSRPDRDRVRAELGLGKRRVVLFVGRFVERKGLGLLHGLAAKLPDVGWLFAGHGPLDPGTWNLPNVYVERDRSGATLAELYGAADLLALPSLGEGFPLVVSEALATGLPTLVDPSTIAGCPEVASVADSESVLGPDALSRWAARIGRIIDDETGRAAMAPQRVEFARSHWDWDRAAAAYAQLFADVRGGPAGGLDAAAVRPIR
jgi:glycosyltransferase involved in cell wall biosynthesis